MKSGNQKKDANKKTHLRKLGQLETIKSRNLADV
jgi:hypothetical protein